MRRAGRLCLHHVWHPGNRLNAPEKAAASFSGRAIAAASAHELISMAVQRPFPLPSLSPSLNPPHHCCPTSPACCAQPAPETPIEKATRDAQNMAAQTAQQAWDRTMDGMNQLREGANT